MIILYITIYGFGVITGVINRVVRRAASHTDCGGVLKRGGERGGGSERWMKGGRGREGGI